MKTFLTLSIVALLLIAGCGGSAVSPTDGANPNQMLDLDPPQLFLVAKDQAIEITWEDTLPEGHSYFLYERTAGSEYDAYGMFWRDQLYTHEDLTNGVTYCYVSTIAHEADGLESERSEEVCATPLPEGGINFAASPGNKAIALDWDIVGGDTMTYRIYWNTTGSVTKDDKMIEVDAPPYVHGNLTNGQIYYYAIATKPEEDAESSFLSEVSAVPAMASNAVVEIFNSDGEYADKFGHSVAIDGDFAIVTEPGNDEKWDEGGAVSMYRRNEDGQWNFDQKVTSTVPTTDGNFGFSVDISDGRAIVGAPTDDVFGNVEGSARIIAFDNDFGVWRADQTLMDFETMGGERFGHSVAIDGNRAVVGYSTCGTSGGSVMFFEAENDVFFAEKQRIVPPATGFDWICNFGVSVDLEGDRLIVGVNAARQTGRSTSGVVIVYQHDGTEWVEGQILVPSDDVDYTMFGDVVALSGDVIVVGAPNRNHPADGGAVYVFRYDGAQWNEEQKLVGESTDEYAFFGSSVAIDGNYILVGEPGAYVGEYDAAGFTCVYEYSGGAWDLMNVLQHPDPDHWDKFGESVSISDGDILVGAPNDETYRGSAFFF